MGVCPETLGLVGSCSRRPRCRRRARRAIPSRAGRSVVAQTGAAATDHPPCQPFSRNVAGGRAVTRAGAGRTRRGGYRRSPSQGADRIRRSMIDLGRRQTDTLGRAPPSSPIGRKGGPEPVKFGTIRMILTTHLTLALSSFSILWLRRCDLTSISGRCDRARHPRTGLTTSRSGSRCWGIFRGGRLLANRRPGLRWPRRSRSRLMSTTLTT